MDVGKLDMGDWMLNRSTTMVILLLCLQPILHIT